MQTNHLRTRCIFVSKAVARMIKFHICGIVNAVVLNINKGIAESLTRQIKMFAASFGCHPC